MKTWMLFVIAAVVAAFDMGAAPLFHDSESARSDVELCVEGIHRICPTGMWDHWTFRDIMFDRESNTVLFVIQLHSWQENRTDSTEADALREAEWIVSNFKEGYQHASGDGCIRCDGDFMLYLSIGSLLKQMEKEGTNLRILLLKPDYLNQVFGEIPMVLSSEQLMAVPSE